MPHLNHIGLYVNDIEGAKHFFEKYFYAKAGEKYHNPRKSFSSYLLSFGNGATLEIMTKPGLNSMIDRTNNYGYAHISMSVGSKEKVDELTKRMIDDGFSHVDGPRTTGDGYYESAILDEEGNIIEITV
jgi:putative lactoylglutathione lyase